MIEYMKPIKDLFDPNGIMNPYKVLPHKYNE
jgi:FAD/FMN-containing dehydrogenase